MLSVLYLAVGAAAIPETYFLAERGSITCPGDSIPVGSGTCVDAAKSALSQEDFEFDIDFQQGPEENPDYDCERDADLTNTLGNDGQALHGWEVVPTGCSVQSGTTANGFTTPKSPAGSTPHFAERGTKNECIHPDYQLVCENTLEQKGAIVLTGGASSLSSPGSLPLALYAGVLACSAFYL